MNRTFSLLTSLMLGWSFFLGNAHAAEQQSFKDVPPSSGVFQAVEFLRAAGVLSGYSDGTFRPEAKVDRAASLKVIVASHVKPEDLTPLTTSTYTDIPAGTWYLPYAEAARQLGIIDGPPKATAFHGERPVTKVEFLKMFFVSEKVDVAGSFAEIKLPLSIDVQDPSTWYYPHLRYAITASMTSVTKEGKFSPEKQLTRGDVALLLFRYVMYRQGRRTQALLSEAETEILNILQSLDKKDITQAELASARATLAARGALAAKPDDPLVKGAIKVTEGFAALVQAYRAGSENRLQDAINLAGSAWSFAAKAKEFSPSLSSITTQMQTIAKSIADQARALQKQSQK